MKSIEQRLEDLASLSDVELQKLEDDIRADFDQADEEDDVDRMEARVANLAALNAHVESLVTDEADNDEDEDDEDEDDEDSDEDTESDEDDEDDSAEDKSTVTAIDKKDTTADATKAVSANTEKEGQAMAASADFNPPEDHQPVVAAATTKVLAGADIQGFSAGVEFKNLDEVSQAFVQRLNSIKRTRGGDGMQHTVASIVASIPEDRVLDPGDAFSNSEKIQAVTSDEAITASGGWCAPLPVNYNIFGMGSTVRPVRDSLPTFGATRGGIRFIKPPKLGDYADAIGVWTAANDADPGSDGPATKPCLKVECAEEDESVLDAVTLCLEFGNLMTRAFPELIRRHNELALVQHARFAETRLLGQISAKSTAVTSGFRLGVARDFLLAVGKASAAYRNRHRVSRTTPLRVIAPEWVLDAMREDLAQGLPGDRLAEADSIISGYLRARNVNITWHMEDLFANQTAGALVSFPDVIKWYIFAEGTFLRLDGGTLDLGVIRDSDLVGTNDYKTFVESFEGLAMVGLESIQVTTTTQVDGALVGTVPAASIPAETP